MQLPPGEPTQEMKASARRWIYRGVIALCVFSILAVVGWHWRAGVLLTSVEVRDSCESSWFTSSPGCAALLGDAGTIARLAGAETNVALYSVDPSVIADRVVRHPWVRSADVSRTPTGRLVITVSPREPRLLVVQRGTPVYFVDEDGYRMPFVEEVAYDLPLLYGLNEKFHPIEPVKSSTVRALAAMMVDLDPAIDALISELELRSSGEILIHTTAAKDTPSIEVRVQADDLPNQLQKLRAYWTQHAVKTRDFNIKHVDLRFDSRIITR